MDGFQPPEAGRPRSSISLLLIADGSATTHALDEVPAITLGRGPDNDIVIAHASVSNRHARIGLTPLLTIEDLGSERGTRVRSTLLKPGVPTPFAHGEVLQLGAVAVALQEYASGAPLRRIWPYGYFQARVEEECARGARSSRGFVVAHLRVPKQVEPAAAEQALFEALRASDVIGRYASQEYSVLFLDTQEDHVDAMLARISQQLAAHDAPVEMGVARYGHDARSAGGLLSAARRAARRADDSAAESPPPVQAPKTMQRLRSLVELIAPSDLSVLILGETGVGKDVLADNIHRLSRRAARPCLRLNCAGLSETLLDSELFGHERGAFTGAVKSKLGLLETAEGGTVFLDEVGEIPLPVQSRLLRVIETRRFRRVGGIETREVDVRFLAATNRNLDAEVERGTFRRDLFFRLNGVTLVVPPLRERTDEIEALARAFISQAAERSGRGAPAIAPEALRLLLQYPWPGNIRELRNVIERAVVLAGDQPITEVELPVEMMSTVVARRGADEPSAKSAAPTARSHGALEELQRSIRDLERERIVEALSQCGGNQTDAARLVGMSRRGFLNKLDALGIARPRKKR